VKKVKAKKEGERRKKKEERRQKGRKANRKKGRKERKGKERKGKERKGKEILVLTLFNINQLQDGKLTFRLSNVSFLAKNAQMKG